MFQEATKTPLLTSHSEHSATKATDHRIGLVAVAASCRELALHPETELTALVAEGLAHAGVVELIDRNQDVSSCLLISHQRPSIKAFAAAAATASITRVHWR